MHAALATDVLAEYDDARIHGELVLQRAADRGDHVDARSFGMHGLRTFAQLDAFAQQTALLLQIDGAIRTDFTECVARDVRDIRHGASLDAAECALHVFACPRFERAPRFLADRRRHQLLTQLHERIARAFRGDLIGRLVGLGVLTGMTGQPRYEQPQQHGPLTGANGLDGIRDGRGGGARIRTIPFQDLEIAERREIGGDIAAGRLELGLHRNPVAVVFQEEQHRQPLGRSDGERRPETVGRDRSLTAMCHGDAACDVLVAQNLRAILQRLRPTDDRRVLRTYTAAGRQHARSFATRQIEHDSDVATFADAARAHHRRGECIFDRQPEREHQRPRAVVHADSIACTRQHLTEQRLSDVMPARGELVEHLALG